MNKTVVLASLFCFFVSSGWAGESLSEGRDLELIPDRVQSFPASSLVLQVVRIRGEFALPVSGISFLLSSVGSRETPAQRVTDAFGKVTYECKTGERVRFFARLDSPYFEIAHKDVPYSIQFEASCGNAFRLEFNANSQGGQAFGVWQIAHRAQMKLEEQVGLAFWRRKIKIDWPSSDDSYENGEMRISQGDHWDVIGHEFGHAIYEMASMGAWVDGNHKIDRCYTAEVALAEGWATFFSAWLSLDSRAEDPHFEFLAPRVALVSIENVPAKTCWGMTNEWRVAAFLWDLLDTHEDGERAAIPFKVLWNAMDHGNFRSIDQVKSSLIHQDLSPVDLDALWLLNFIKH